MASADAAHSPTEIADAARGVILEFDHEKRLRLDYLLAVVDKATFRVLSEEAKNFRGAALVLVAAFVDDDTRLIDNIEIEIKLI